MKYTQCQLRKNNVTEISWIPEKFAIPNKILDIKINNIWDKGWMVEEVYSSLSEEAVVSASQQYRYHRNNTDI